MLQRAQGIFKQVQDRVVTTLQVVADLAESVGVPAKVTSLLQRGGGAPPLSFDDPTGVVVDDRAGSSGIPETPAGLSATAATHAAPAVEPEARSGGNGHEARQGAPRNGRKRVLIGDRAKSNQVSALRSDDAISGSTYLARIVWALGIAQLEGLGSLRPADIARMIMARSPVSLEPPNVARYIRRSNPSCIAVDRTEGSSSFYKLNTQGKKLFDTTFCSN